MQTQVITLYDERRGNLRLLFGDPVETRKLEERKGYTKTLNIFEEGQLFALDCWLKNDYGTRSWRVLVCKCARAGERVYTVPLVRPGALILFDVTGQARAKKALAAFRDIEKTRPLASLTEGEFEVLSTKINAYPTTPGRTLMRGRRRATRT